MSVHVCCLILALLSAASADVETTRQFTAQGFHEANPLARPFVEGPGARGELVVAVATTGTYILLAQESRAWRISVQVTAWTIHSMLAVRNVREKYAREVPLIVLPLFIVTW